MSRVSSIRVLSLRRVPARFYGVFMSVNPVFAALVGLMVLGQSLQSADWLAILVIVAANALTLGMGVRARAGAPRRDIPPRG
jgi:inner membrane transporter RhtA